MGLDAPIELPRGAMDDWRRGDDPMAVFMGDRERGGGRCVRLLRRIAADVVMFGMEPTILQVSADYIWQLVFVHNFCRVFARTVLDVHRL